VRGIGGPLAAAALAAASLTLGGCNFPADTGYVEIRTVPVASSASPSLYLDTVKLDPVRKGVAVLKQRIGTVKLATDAGGGQLAPICDIVVKKNRITTVTVSVLDRPPRCQCRNPGGKQVCLS
jgi:hypothetical protein